MVTCPHRSNVALASLAFLTFATSSCQAVSDAPPSEKPRAVWTRRDAAGGFALPYADSALAVFTTAFARRVVALDAASGGLRWQRDLPPGPAGVNMPLANVVATKDMLIVPAWDLYALDRSTGAVRWHVGGVAVDYPAASSIALVGDRIIAPGSVRQLYALDAISGTVLWTVDLAERPFAPVVDGGTIYVGTSGPRGDNSDVLGAGHAVALRTDNGAVLWKTPLPDAPDSPWVGGTTQGGALTPDLFIVASSNGRVYGISRQNGEVRWEFRGSGPYFSGVAVINGIAVVAALTGEITGLDAATGAVRWHASTGGSSVINQITSDGSFAYVSVGAILCIDAKGTIRWNDGGASNGGPSYSTSATVVGARLFAGSTSGFHALRVP